MDGGQACAFVRRGRPGAQVEPAGHQRGSAATAGRIRGGDRARRRQKAFDRRSRFMTEQEYMRLAIRKAQEGIAIGQSPFGSVIVHGGEVVAATHNTVWHDGDPTAHAEVNCIRAAARALKTIFLHGCELYSTTEPCPMCL